MKEIKMNLGTEGRDVILQIPDEIEITREEAFALAAIKGQELVADGIIVVTQRVWPCFYCGKSYLSQGRLTAHLHEHDERKEKVEGHLAKFLKPTDHQPNQEKKEDHA